MTALIHVFIFIYLICLFKLIKSKDTIPVRQTSLDSTKHILDICCKLLWSGQWSICDYVRVQFSGLHWTPLDTHLSGLQSDFNFQRVQSVRLCQTLWTPFSGQNSILYSSGLRWTPAVPTCDNMWQGWSPVKSSRIQQNPAESGRVRQIMWGSVKYWLERIQIAENIWESLWPPLKIIKLI